MDEPAVKIIDVFICKLRKKLANASMGKNYIETIWGGGHVLREPTDTEEAGLARRRARPPAQSAPRKPQMKCRNSNRNVDADLRTY
jgi:hypothetical protein